jgi:glycosyltransferase involved in cell wall biosynthesis
VTRRILLIAADQDADGAEALRFLSEELPRSEFDVHALLIADERRSRIRQNSGGIPQHARTLASSATIRRDWPLDPRLWWRLRRHIKPLRPDMLHVWEPAGQIEIRTAARALGIKAVVSAGLDLDRPWTRAESIVERRLARWSRAVVADGGAARSEAVARGLPAEKLHVIPPAVAVAPRSTLSRADALRQLGLRAEARVVAAMSPLVRSARLKDLIWAFDLVRLACCDAHLVIVGAGPEHGALEDFAASQEAHEHVHIVPPGDAIGGWFDHADVLWFNEPCIQPPRAVLQAMAHGVPVMTTDSPGAREVFRDGQEGIIAPRCRAELARATLDLLADEARRNRIAAAARQRVADEFSASRMVQRCKALYDLAR